MRDNKKWPRHYAAEIADLPTKEDKLAAFKQVPVEYKPLVKEHLKTIHMWRQFSP